MFEEQNKDVFEFKNHEGVSGKELKKSMKPKNAYEKSLEIGDKNQKEESKEPLRIPNASSNCKKCYGRGYTAFFRKIGDYDLPENQVPVICSCVEKNEAKLEKEQEDVSSKIF